MAEQAIPSDALITPSDTFTSKTHNDTYLAISPRNVDFSNRAVFISGGSKGIGKAMTLSIASAGASFIAVGARSDMSAMPQKIKDAAKAAGRKEPQILLVKLDVTDRASVENAAKTIEEAFGKLDIVINNAGIMGEMTTLAESDPDVWWQTFNVNLRGPYLVMRTFIPLLLKGGEKTIVNVGSVGAWLCMPTLGAYQTTKLALTRLSEFVAVENGQQGILCYTIHPGNVVTEIMGPDGPPAEFRHLFSDTPEISADTIVFLTKERRTWLQGRYISVAWDMPELMSREEEVVKGNKLKIQMSI
ncbi:short chain dehydrogenase reductase [Aulographum hederae CBS 113979]|uniref:Short chain dehydrogenase reductase n=1 Tax=Aulographum hederae CBS 113979 TaxID=1176131 RepID=A0A6G1HEM7_9PEZI|nr:short chain dehydrogenase reductase [Aulographum hederae CBS 113979]